MLTIESEHINNDGGQPLFEEVKKLGSSRGNRGKETKAEGDGNKSSLTKSSSTPSTVNTGFSSSPASGNWKVILHEDDVNSLGYAEYSLKEVIQSMSAATAREIRNEALRNKKAIVLRAQKPEAEKILFNLQIQGLTVTLEPELLVYNPDSYEYCYHTKTPKDVTYVTINEAENIGEEGGDMDSPTFSEIIDEAFMDCSVLKRVDFNCKNLTRIGRDAFRECSFLTSITIPEGVTEIGPYAFTGCFSLTSVILPTTLTKIGKHAFRRCTSLTTIHIHNTKVSSIETSSFESCVSLPTIYIPSTVTSIGRYAFRDCYSLASVTIPPTLTHISTGAFEKCFSLISIQLPPSATTIKKDTFVDCPQLGKTSSSNVISKLRARFQKLPLHTLCYDPQITLDSLKSFLQEQSSDSNKSATAESVDIFHCTALHILVSNPNVTNNMLKCLIEQYPQATSIPNQLGMLPLQQACYNTHAPHDIFETLGMYYRLDLNSHSVVNWNDVEVDFGSNMDTVTDENQPRIEMPLVLANRFNLHENVTQILFSVHPIVPKYRQVHNQYHRRKSMAGHDVTSTSPKNFVEDDEEDESSSLHKLFLVGEKYEARMFQTLHDWTESSTMSHFMEYGFIMYLSNLEDEKTVDKWQQFLLDSNRCPFEGIQFFSQITFEKEEEEEKEEESPPEYEKRDKYASDKNISNVSPSQLLLDMVDPKIKDAVMSRLTFLGRYKIDKTIPFLYRSDSCVIIEAIDVHMIEFFYEIFQRHNDKVNGKMNQVQLKLACLEMNISTEKDKKLFDKLFKPREGSLNHSISEEDFVSFCQEKMSSKVALKFIKDEKRFNREIENISTVNSLHVLNILRGHSLNMKNKAEQIATFLGSSSSQLYDPQHFNYCLVMPLCNRNLDTVFQCERPNQETIKTYMKQIAEGLQYLHEEAGLVHANLKPSNIVRYMNRMSVIDLSASVTLSKENAKPSYIGEKFSSVMLPPEMIHPVYKNTKEERKYRNYFGSHLNKLNDVKWTSSKTEKKGFVVKTFLSENNSDMSKDMNIMRQRDESELPYKLIEATPAIDIWAFGCILYKLCTGYSLFSSDIDYNMIDGDQMELIMNWNTLMKHKKLENVDDIHAWDLLNKIFLENPSKRPQSMREILSHSYFASSKNDQYILEKETAMKEYKRKNMNSMSNSEVEFGLENSSTKLLHTFFERADVDTPTSFCIVPIVKSERSTERIDFLNTIIEFVDEVIEEKKEKSILDTVTNLFGRYCKKGFCLELLDEWTVHTVIYQYPIKVKLTCEQLCQFLPVMLIDWKNKIKANKGIGIAHIFKPDDSFEELKETKKVISGLVNKFVDYLVSRKGNAIFPSRDGLREFSNFLSNRDKGELYGGLVRIINCGTGDSMWISHESKDAMNKLMPLKSLDPLVTEMMVQDIRKTMTDAEKKKEEWVNQKVADLVSTQLCAPWNGALDFTTF